MATTNKASNRENPACTRPQPKNRRAVLADLSPPVGGRFDDTPLRVTTLSSPSLRSVPPKKATTTGT
jgi:hypothetical protein